MNAVAHGPRQLRPRRRLPRRWLLAPALVLAIGGAPTLAGCGPGEGETTGPAPPKIAPPKRGARRGGKSVKGGLSFYKKVEEYAANDDEKKRLRHRFDNLDFEPDITGIENRDPFRSYVIRQPGEGPQDASQQSTTATSDECDNKDHVAANYPLRDLRLVGIVLRGTKSYALFRDSAAYGHIVRKGDCLGQEKAKVASIRTGFVNLQVIPESAPNQPDKPPQEKAIQLYPDELLPDIEP